MQYQVDTIKVSSQEANDFFNYFNSLNIEESKLKKIDIIFSKSVQNIDIIFVAIVFLITNQCNFEVEFSFEEKNEGDLNDESLPYYRIKLYVDQLNFLYFPNLRKKVHLKGGGKIKEFGSRNLLPIIFLNGKDSFDVFFESSQNESVDLVSKRYWTFYLEALKIESDYYDNGVVPETISYVRDPEIIDYLLDKYDILTQKVKNSSSIHLLIYTVCLHQFPFERLNKDSYIKFIQKLFEIWEFTIVYVKGLKELAKNIIQHTNSKKGIITFRAYKSDRETLEIETYVVDLDEKGIINKLFEYTNQINNPVNERFTEDIYTINNDFKIEDIIKPTPLKKLNQQLKRDFAHLGMHYFYSILEENKGYVNIRSNGFKTITPDKYNNNTAENYIPLEFGTSYFFRIPFNEEKFVSKQIDTSFFEPKSSFLAINGLLEVFDLKFVDYEVGISFTNTDFVNINLYKMIDRELSSILDRNHEKVVIDKIKTLKLIGANYLAFDFNELSFSEGSILRFLAFLTSFFYEKKIIIYNILTREYSKIIEGNKYYVETYKKISPHIPFWNENNAILIYSQVSDPTPLITSNNNNINSYYFADLLFGKEESDFINVNYQINKSFPNAYSISNENVNMPYFSVPEKLNSFFNNNVLLPFDTIVKIRENETIFSNNFRFAIENNLDNEIK